jgi:hypothetical protein
LYCVSNLPYIVAYVQMNLQLRNASGPTGQCITVLAKHRDSSTLDQLT